MAQLPVSHDLQPVLKPRARPDSAITEAWRKLEALVTNPEYLAIVAFCLVGLLAMLALMAYFPDLGLLIEQLGW